MGYTHYVTNTAVTAKQEAFDRLKEATLKVLKDHKDIIVGPYGEMGTQPMVSEGAILFNGIEEDSHETMAIPLKLIPEFKFCKTARKPYDKVVVACLALMSLHLGRAVYIESDGSVEEWQEGFDIALKYVDEKSRSLLVASSDNSFNKAFIKRILGD